MTSVSPEKWIACAVSKDPVRENLRAPQRFVHDAIPWGKVFSTDGHRLHLHGAEIACIDPLIKHADQVIPRDSESIRAVATIDHSHLAMFRAMQSALKELRKENRKAEGNALVSVTKGNTISLEPEWQGYSARVSMSQVSKISTGAPEIVMAVEIRYLVDALAIMGPSGATIEFRGKLDPLVIKGIGRPEWLAVVMPRNDKNIK